MMCYEALIVLYDFDFSVCPRQKQFYEAAQAVTRKFTASS
jgi:hypothetical protein